MEFSYLLHGLICDGEKINIQYLLLFKSNNYTQLNINETPIFVINSFDVQSRYCKVDRRVIPENSPFLVVTKKNICNSVISKL